MNKKGSKNDPKVNLNMGFEEVMKRLSNVPKEKVDKNIQEAYKRRERER